MPAPTSRETTTTGRHPAPVSLLLAYEAEALETAQRVAAESEAVARRLFPAGRINATIRGRATRTRSGVAVRVAPAGELSYIARFVEGGTGVYGPERRVIPVGRRGRLRGGRLPSGRGQQAQHVFARLAELEGARVLRELEDAAERAPRRVGL